MNFQRLIFAQLLILSLLPTASSTNVTVIDNEVVTVWLDSLEKELLIFDPPSCDSSLQALPLGGEVNFSVYVLNKLDENLQIQLEWPEKTFETRGEVLFGGKTNLEPNEVGLSTIFISANPSETENKTINIRVSGQRFGYDWEYLGEFNLTVIVKHVSYSCEEVYELKGTIKDNSGLVNAYVEIVPIPQRFGLIANVSGEFSFSLPEGTYMIGVHSVKGHSYKLVEIPNNLHLEFTLSQVSEVTGNDTPLWVYPNETWVYKELLDVDHI